MKEWQDDEVKVAFGIQINPSYLDGIYVQGGKIKDRYDNVCLLYTSPSPRDATLSRMPSSA